jgi:predicted DNA-binding ribbon-helix-helix protein
VSGFYSRQRITDSNFPWGPTRKSSVVKRSVVIDGHKTSVSLEEPFWRDLKEIAQRQRVTLSQIIAMIDSARLNKQSNLSSAIRLFVFEQVSNRKNGSTRLEI